jgi:hypothetical protein
MQNRTLLDILPFKNATMDMDASCEQFFLQFYHYQHLIFEQAHSNAPCDHVLQLQWTPHMG